MSSTERLLVGVVTGAQGIRGAVRIKSFTADPDAVGAYGPLLDESGTRRFALRVVGRAKGVVIAMIDGVADRNQAEALKGTRLHVDRAQLPPPADAEEYYHADLIGLAARLADGSTLGTVRAVHDFGAGDCLEVALAQGGARGSRGGTILVPFTRAAVPVVDLAGGCVVVDPPAGLFEPPEPVEAVAEPAELGA